MNDAASPSDQLRFPPSPYSTNTSGLRRRSFPGWRHLPVGLRFLVGAFSLWSVTARGSEVVSLGGGTWRIAPQAEINATGEQISTRGFAAEAWQTAQVPGTVFNAYVLAGKEKDPNFRGQHLSGRPRQVRPQLLVSHRLRRARALPPEPGVAEPGRGQPRRRRFRQRASGGFDARLFPARLFRRHGSRADRREELPGGARLRAGALSNCETPQTRDKENFSSPAFICTRGWDWMPRVPGLDMGIYKDVYLSATGNVSLHDPWVRTDKASAESAELSIATELQNHSSGDVSGQLEGEINPGEDHFRAAGHGPRGASQTVTMTSQTVAALRLNKPRAVVAQRLRRPEFVHGSDCPSGSATRSRTRKTSPSA